MATNGWELAGSSTLHRNRRQTSWLPCGIWWFCTSRGVSLFDPSAAAEGREAFRNFTFKDGFLPGIHAVTQTPDDGVMWLGAFSGLIGFDGTNAINVTAEAGLDLRVDSPAVDSTGNIWFTALNT
jgi:hypothetical protein